jgi:hypothetical protein
MSGDTSKIEMVITLRAGVRTSYETIDDQEFLGKLLEIEEWSLRTPGELIRRAFEVWLRTAEGQRVTGIIEGKKAIAAGDVHDFDDVIAELEVILRGEDSPGDG